MRSKEVVIEQQKDFIQEIKNKTYEFIKSLNKSEIETILLSGSVSRGDYFPEKKEDGEYNGMVDLIVMRKKGSKIKADDIFGPNQEPEIPFHCVKVNNLWFEILFTDFIDVQKFSKFEEARKFSVLESEILYDSNDLYKKELEKINNFVESDVKEHLNNTLGYIHYLISDYKKDRWYRRGAFIQLHENLNTAIRAGIRSLFYLNSFYSPAEDRTIYYSHSLKKLPDNYSNLIIQLYNQNIDSEENYFRREELFIDNILEFIEKKLKIGK